jgi:hypothetical protein
MMMLLLTAWLALSSQSHPQAVNGVVQDTACHPLPGVTVSGTSPDAKPVVTDARGRFSLAVEANAAEVQLHARLAGFRDAVRTGTFTGAYGDQIVTLDTGDLATVDRVAGVPPAPTDPRLRGIVLTSRCAPIAGAEVQISGGKSEPRTIKTGADGRFAFDPLPDGSYLVSVHAPSYMPLFRYETKVGPDTRRDLRLVLDHAGNGTNDAWLAR